MNSNGVDSLGAMNSDCVDTENAWPNSEIWPFDGPDMLVSTDMLDAF